MLRVQDGAACAMEAQVELVEEAREVACRGIEAGRGLTESATRSSMVFPFAKLRFASLCPA